MLPPLSSQLIFIALGSNLGDSRQLVAKAMDRLQSLSAERLLKSSLWRTTPVDCPPGSPPLINAVVGLVPREGETPETLLDKLRLIEQDFGRPPKTVSNEPRSLDLDLIAWGNETRSTPTLTLPHPRAHLRRFVLQPLSEIAPELILPGQMNTISGLLANLNSAEVVRKLT